MLLTFVAALAPVLGIARLPPVDQCAWDASFVQFRTELRHIVARRDSERLLSIVADDVLVDFGGGHDKAAFVRHWNLARPGTTKVWTELATALRLGCAREGEMRVAPSFGTQLNGGRDPFETLIALPRGALRRERRDGSQLVARLDWHVLTIRGPWDGGPWVAVTLDDGRRGFIRRDQTRSPIDYRAIFERRGGRWLMRAFVAGD